LNDDENEDENEEQLTTIEEDEREM
jgi:hypothetical protein